MELLTNPSYLNCVFAISNRYDKKVSKADRKNVIKNLV